MRVQYEKKLESVRAKSSIYIEAMEKAMLEVKLRMCKIEERCEMRVNEYESMLNGQSESMEKNAPKITELMLEDAQRMEENSEEYISSL